jgi:cyclohexanone monooxygenase
VTPVVAQVAAHLTVFQRTANFSLPSQNKLMDPEFEAEWKRNYAAHRQAARESPAGIQFTGGLRDCSALSVSDEERERVYEEAWHNNQNGPFGLFFCFNDLLSNVEANETVSEFVRKKIRERVDDPHVAELLCPKDHPFGTKRPCVDTNYFETFNRPNVTLVNVKSNPIAEITPTGLKLQDGTEYDGDVIIFATGFDALTGGFLRMGITGRDGLKLERKWESGPRTYLGVAMHQFPNLFMITGPGSPSVLSNMTTSIEQHTEWIRDVLIHLRDADLDTVEANLDAEEEWVAHVRELADATLFIRADSWFVGANIPGKPRVFMPYLGGVGNYRSKCDEVAANGYEGFTLSRSTSPVG